MRRRNRKLYGDAIFLSADRVTRASARKYKTEINWKFSDGSKDRASAYGRGWPRAYITSGKITIFWMRRNRMATLGCCFYKIITARIYVKHNCMLMPVFCPISQEWLTVRRLSNAFFNRSFALFFCSSLFRFFFSVVYWLPYCNGWPARSNKGLCDWLVDWLRLRCRGFDSGMKLQQAVHGWKRTTRRKMRFLSNVLLFLYTKLSVQDLFALIMQFLWDFADPYQYSQEWS